ncbi:MAG: Obg family GTPase CgtA, partial [Eubacteriales bacterium]
RDPLDDLRVINEELEKYSPALAARPRILAANKMDMADEDTVRRLQAYADERGIPAVFMSAAIGEGTDELKELISRKLCDLPPLKVYEPEIELDDTQDAAGEDEIRVTNVNGVYHVEAERLINVINSINFNDYESMNYFQKILRNSGVIAALEEKGIKDGDTVSLYDVEFDYYK